MLQSRGVRGGKRLHTVALGSVAMGAPTVALLKTLARATGGGFHVYDGDLDDIADDTGVYRAACDNADVHAVRAAIGVAAGTLALVRALITEYEARRRIPSLSSSLRQSKQRQGTSREGRNGDGGAEEEEEVSDGEGDGPTPTQRWLARNSAAALRLRLADMLPAARSPDAPRETTTAANTPEVVPAAMTSSPAVSLSSLSLNTEMSPAPQEGNVRGTVQLAGQSRAVWRQAGVPQYVPWDHRGTDFAKSTSTQ